MKSLRLATPTKFGSSFGIIESIMLYILPHYVKPFFDSVSPHARVEGGMSKKKSLMVVTGINVSLKKKFYYKFSC